MEFNTKEWNSDSWMGTKWKLYLAKHSVSHLVTQETSTLLSSPVPVEWDNKIKYATHVLTCWSAAFFLDLSSINCNPMQKSARIYSQLVLLLVSSAPISKEKKAIHRLVFHINKSWPLLRQSTIYYITAGYHRGIARKQ